MTISKEEIGRDNPEAVKVEPFHVSRSSDGNLEWFSARDAATGVSIPARSREDAYAMVGALNRSVAHRLALAAVTPSAGAGEAERLIERLADAYGAIARNPNRFINGRLPIIAAANAETDLRKILSTLREGASSHE